MMGEAHAGCNVQCPRHSSSERSGTQRAPARNTIQRAAQNTARLARPANPLDNGPHKGRRGRPAARLPGARRARVRNGPHAAGRRPHAAAAAEKGVRGGAPGAAEISDQLHAHADQAARRQVTEARGARPARAAEAARGHQLQPGARAAARLAAAAAPRSRGGGRATVCCPSSPVSQFARECCTFEYGKGPPAFDGRRRPARRRGISPSTAGDWDAGWWAEMSASAHSECPPCYAAHCAHSALQGGRDSACMQALGGAGLTGPRLVGAGAPSRSCRVALPQQARLMCGASSASASERPARRFPHAAGAGAAGGRAVLICAWRRGVLVQLPLPPRCPRLFPDHHLVTFIHKRYQRPQKRPIEYTNLSRQSSETIQTPEQS